MIRSIAGAGMLAFGLAITTATVAASDPIEGIWRTEPDDGAYAHVSIAPCGTAYCGTIVHTFDASGEYNSSSIGKQLVHNMAPQGDGRYRGRVWRPSNDRVYIGKAEVSGDRMTLSGCVVGGLICAAQDWTRVR